MALPVPDLDDRRFQDLVDEAKRLVQQRCPEWTDHNVHDPGVTMIELFAWMTDQLVYRVNRVPDRLYVKFLELLGVRLFPPVAARVDETFWLSAPQPDTLVVPAGTEISTVRTATEEAIAFVTGADLPIVACSVAHVRSAVEADRTRGHREALAREQEFSCFDTPPKPGDSLLLGLSEATPSNIVTLRFEASIEGIGVDPDDPPLVWEAWTGEAWSRCELDSDSTGGLNRPGDVVLHVPAGHVASLIGNSRGGWLRARVTEPAEGQPAYSASPSIHHVEAFTIGGTVEAANIEQVRGEILGTSAGVAGESYRVTRSPIVPGPGSGVLEVADPESSTGWTVWTQVEDFADSGPDDPHYVLDAVAGEVRLGPAVREADGDLRRYGRTPLPGAVLRLRSYRTGGGAAGNVSRGMLSVLASSVPYVTRVDNRRAAYGGRDGEAMDNAKLRGPIALRTRGRAVTAEDFEQIARAAALDVARVRAVPDESVTGGGVRVLVVPAVPDDHGRLEFGQLVPADDTLSRIADALERCRVLGTRISVEPPTYQGITVVARLRARVGGLPLELRDAALEALHRYFHPVLGGPDGAGWPFGRTVHVGEVYSVLQRLPGIDLVEDARLFVADPVTGQRGTQSQRVELDQHALVFSYEHQVRVSSP